MCLICERIEQIKQDENRYFVTELETGYVVFGDHQTFEGYTLFLCKEHVTELHYLENNFKLKFLEEMSIVAEAVYNVFEPDKMNYELLGNGDTHVHWHLFPRSKGDTEVAGPVWWMPREQMWDERNIMTDQFYQMYKTKLVAEIKRLKEKL